MERNPAHTYLSALPFTSPKSLISTFFLKKFPGVLHINLDTHEEPQPVLTAAVSGNMVAVISNSFLKLFDFTREGAEVFHAALDPIQKPVRYCLSVSHDQTMVALGGIGCDIWHLDKARRFPLLLVQGPPSTEAHTTCMAFSDDGEYIVAGFSDGTLREWAVDSGMEGRPFLWPNDVDDLKREDVRTAVYAQNDDCIISGSRMNPFQVRIYVWSRSGDCTFSYLLSRCDEHRLILCARWLISSYDAYSDPGNERWEIQDALTGELAFKCSPRPGEYFTWSSVKPWEQFYPLIAPASTISLDGKLAAFILDVSILIWDVHENIGLVELVGHSALLSSVGFVESHGESNYRLVSTSLDGTIRLWDLDQLVKPKEDQQIQHPMMSWSVCPQADGGSWKGGSWIQNEKGECLFWLPATCPIRHPLNTLVIGPCAELDMTNFVYGEEWTKCRRSEADDKPSEAAR
jgi:WD40 repeat protein